MSRKIKPTLAILISNTGTGTNLLAIIEAVKAGKIKAKIAAVVSDVKDAPALDHAKKYKIKIKICPSKDKLREMLRDIDPDYVCLAGWKQIILDEVINSFPNRILNLHPGLIPDTAEETVKNPDGTDALWNKGMLTNKAIQNFLTQKVTYVGSSVHFLTLNFDFGPVLGRVFEKVEPSDTVESVYKRLKAKENELYVGVLEKLCSN